MGSWQELIIRYGGRGDDGDIDIYEEEEAAVQEIRERKRTIRME